MARCSAVVRNAGTKGLTCLEAFVATFSVTVTARFTGVRRQKSETMTCLQKAGSFKYSFTHLTVSLFISEHQISR